MTVPIRLKAKYRTRKPFGSLHATSSRSGVRTKHTRKVIEALRAETPPPAHRFLVVDGRTGKSHWGGRVPIY